MPGVVRQLAMWAQGQDARAYSPLHLPSSWQVLAELATHPAESTQPPIGKSGLPYHVRRVELWLAWGRSGAWVLSHAPPVYPEMLSGSTPLPVCRTYGLNAVLIVVPVVGWLMTG